MKKVMNDDERMKEYEKRVAECYSTQGYKKLWAYFNEILKKDDVQEIIDNLRDKFKIPQEGLPKCAEGKDYFTTPPETWTFYYNKEKAHDEIMNKLEKICKKYHLHYLDWYEILEHYLFYNEVSQTYHSNSYNLCLVQDLVFEKKEAELEKQDGSYTGSFERCDDFAFPVAIRISPYASQRDIIDYVKKMYPSIREVQETYIDKNIKIGRIKRKNEEIQKRNDYIYENRSKPVKEIRKLLAGKKIFLDDGHIAKIISLEKQKRKEV